MAVTSRVPTIPARHLFEREAERKETLVEENARRRSPWLTRVATRGAFSALFLLSVLIAAPSAASTTDVWTDPYPGVRHLYRTTDDPNRIHVLIIDLTRADVHVRATRYADRGRTVSSFASLYGAAVAVNGDFHGPSWGGDIFDPAGMAIGSGERWSGISSVDGTEESFIAFGESNRVYVSAPWDIVLKPKSWMTELVSGRELVTQKGAASDYVAGNPDVHPRTSAGISRDGETLFLAVVDGRSTVSVGMTLYQLGQLMASVGTWQAINLDGGGSTTMYVAAEGGVQNVPSDGSERAVANHLGVVIGP
jgi:exopolysaccharide biosynthesis protein